MGKYAIILITICLVVWPVVECFFIWLPKHKREMKKFNEDLEESQWRKENWNKTVGQESNHQKS